MRYLDAVHQAGISERQAVYWRAQGYVVASSDGSGTISEISSKEAAILFRTSILVRAGMKAANAAQIARTSIEQDSSAAELPEGLRINFPAAGERYVRADLRAKEVAALLEWNRATTDALVKDRAALSRVREVCDAPHVIPVQTLDGIQNAPVIWPYEIRAALDGPGE